MSLTEADLARELAARLFDEQVCPLAEARRTGDQKPFFASAPCAQLASYYDPPTSRVMQPADFEFPGGGTAGGLIDALAARWLGEGESGLAAMAPTLKEIAAALAKEAAERDGTISILCYTMF